MVPDQGLKHFALRFSRGQLVEDHCMAVVDDVAGNDRVFRNGDKIWQLFCSLVHQFGHLFDGHILCPENRCKIQQ